MATKSPGRNRPVNVALPPFVRTFLTELSRATYWDGTIACYESSGSLTGASPENRGDPADTRGFAVGYLFQEIMSKFDDGLTSVVKDQNTWAKFHLAEEMCASTNQRLLNHDSSLDSISVPSVYAVLETARRKISWLLGSFNWNEAHSRMRFTTGASTSLPRRYGHQAYKYSVKMESTFNNLDLANTCITYSPLWNGRPPFEEGPCAQPSVTVVHGNRLESVPKNYKVNRMIAIEPSMNMYVQTGIGGCLRRRLAKVGINLDTGQETNRDLAKFASATGFLATVDLSMASDTVSLELVRALLPADWTEALEQCRSPYGVLPSGESVLYRKFSSMGNGYTFELETLIFWALSYSCATHTGQSTALVSVYGDDIIVPAAATDLLYKVLSYAGFSINEGKSFASGPFRESCGKHYLAGRDVSPFYVKSEDSTLMGLFKIHNQAYRWFVRMAGEGIHFPLAHQFLEKIRGFAPRSWRKPRIPDGMGDGAFIGSFDECTPDRPVSTCSYRTGWEGWYARVLADTASVCSPFVLVDRQSRLLNVNGAFCEQLTSTGSSEPRGGIVRSRRVRQIQIVVPHFGGMSPWSLRQMPLEV